jgi:hypothetical protein
VVSREKVQPAVETIGTMLWFNVEKDIGALRTESGERLDVPGTSFAPGEKPLGRCAGMAVQFERDGDAVSGVTFVTSPVGQRARLRRRH